MTRKLKPHHFMFIRKLLHSHHMRGQVALTPHVPSRLERAVHERMVATKDVAKLYCVPRHRHESMVRMCEAKIFIEMNPDIVEGLVSGQWGNFVDSLEVG
jgi:hypothetical protein